MKIGGERCSGLIIVLSVIIAIEYSNGNEYDLWDVYVGFLSLIIGVTYFFNAKIYKDFLYTFLTSCLISLGIITIGSTILFSYEILVQPLETLKSFQYENTKWLVFIFLSILIHSSFAILMSLKKKKIDSNIKKTRLSVHKTGEEDEKS